MRARAAAHALSLCLAAVVTLAMLGGIDQLSQPQPAAAQWAQPVQATASHG